MRLPETENKWFAKNKPAKAGYAPFLIPRKFKSFSCIFIFSFFTLLTGCNSTTGQGQFELDLFSSVFGDISITQGESTTTTVLIDRNVENSEFSYNINMSLIDPPKWLSYKIRENPVKGTKISIQFDIGRDAKPGIYRLVLHGAGDTKNTVIEDSVTFHLRVKKAVYKQEEINVNFDLRKKLFSLLKPG